MKSKRAIQAERIQMNQQYLQCPICTASVHVEENRQLVCANRHSFDIAKQGYVFLLPKPVQTNYTKELFEQRRKINLETPFYEQFHQTVAGLIQTHLPETSNHPRIVDMGTGEGSHLQMIATYLDRPSVGIGIDIAKEGIVHAAKQNDEQMWFVADLAHSPLAPESMDVIFNILSPSNYKEFARIRARDGVIIKAIPGRAYMKEMRQFFHASADFSDGNDRVHTHFSGHFDQIDVVHVTDTYPLTAEHRRALAQMSPLTWEVTPDRVEAFILDGPSELTIDLDLLVGK